MKGIIIDKNTASNIISLPDDSIITIPEEKLNGKHFGSFISCHDDCISYTSNSKHNRRSFHTEF